MYKTILLPIDLADEESTANAIPVATKLASLFGSELCVLTVVPEDLSLARPGKGSKEDLLQAAQRRLRELSARELATNSPRHVIAYGAPAEEILRVARESNADLVILGSHRPRAQDFLLGSTASQVVRRLPCSALIVRPDRAT
jgi:nucleotide-binding universal stress UspA family protein